MNLKKYILSISKIVEENPIVIFGNKYFFIKYCNNKNIIRVKSNEMQRFEGVSHKQAGFTYYTL